MQKTRRSQHNWWSLKHAMILMQSQTSLMNCELSSDESLRNSSPCSTITYVAPWLLSPECTRQECPALLCHPKRIDEDSESQAWGTLIISQNSYDYGCNDTDDKQSKLQKGLVNTLTSEGHEAKKYSNTHGQCKSLLQQNMSKGALLHSETNHNLLHCFVW